MTARRDKWSNYAEVTTNEEGLFAWSQDPGSWKLVRHHTVYADVSIETTRKRRRDLAGFKKFKVVTCHNIKVTLRAGWSDNLWYTTKTMEFSGGEVATIKQLLKMFRSGALFNHARFDAQIELLNLNATTLQMIEADDIYGWRYDERPEFENEQMRLRQNVELLNRLKAE